MAKEYSNGELTIVWKPDLCIHAGVCVKMLPNVYKPKEKPWITIENATTQELKNQIDQCPSGALSYYLVNEDNEKDTVQETKIDVLENGPLIVHGKVTVTDKDGNKETKEGKTAFCRCGYSKNKPYCDGMHREVDFKG